jgi:hypothetical protein
MSRTTDDVVERSVLNALESRGSMPLERVAKEAGYERGSALVRVALGRLIRRGVVENRNGIFRLTR